MRLRFEFKVDDIDSTNIKNLEFHARSINSFDMNAVGLLHVIFQSSRDKYIYKNVPFSALWNVVTSESIGKTFNIDIARKYKYEKMS
jgi:hypothetical protein